MHFPPLSWRTQSFFNCDALFNTAFGLRRFSRSSLRKHREKSWQEIEAEDVATMLEEDTSSHTNGDWLVLTGGRGISDEEGDSSNEEGGECSTGTGPVPPSSFAAASSSSSTEETDMAAQSSTAAGTGVIALEDWVQVDEHDLTD